MALACPSCGRTIAFKDVKPGRFRVPCPECGRPFALEVGNGPEPTLTARSIESTSPAAGTATAVSWDEARSLGRRVAAALLERAGWAWRASTHRQSLVGGALILEELGRTSRGTVGRGRQILIGRDVLVRTLPAEWGGDNPSSRAKAHREAAIAAEVVHPNLVRRLDFGQERGRRYAIEEDLTGPTLAVMAGRDDWPGGDAAIAAVLHAARGLQAAHDQGLAHGDPSPDNLWLDAAGVVKLAGLGLGDQAASETRDGRGPFAIAAARDVQILGSTLDTLLKSRKEWDSADMAVARSLAMRMQAAGTPEGFPDLAGAIAAMEVALKVNAGGSFLPRDEEARGWEASVAGYHDVALASIRIKLILGFFAACLLFTLLFVRAGNFTLAGGVLGLAAMTGAFYTLIRSGLGRRSGLFGRARELVLGGRKADWLTVLGASAVGLGVLVYLGWLAGWIALGVVAAGFAIGLVVAIDAPIARDRESPLQEARDLLARMRSRGVSELALRDFAVKFGGLRWDELYEALFGLEETRRPSRTRTDPGRSRPIAWRFAAIDWLDARLRDRREARLRDHFEPIEEAALVASKVNEMTARRKSRRIAEALMLVAREVRAGALGGWNPAEAATIRVTPRPIPDLIREAVANPDLLLGSTWSDDREPVRGPNPILRLLAIATGPRARLLAGGLLVAGFLLWKGQVGIFNLDEVRDRVERAIADRDVAHFQELSVDLERARLATEPLAIPGIPPALTRPIVGYGVGAAGLILLVSAFAAGSRVAAFAIPGAAIAWFGSRLGMPAVGPLSSQALASSLGAGLLVIGFFFRRRT